MADCLLKHPHMLLTYLGWAVIPLTLSVTVVSPSLPLLYSPSFLTRAYIGVGPLGTTQRKGTTVPQQAATAGPWVACLAAACSPAQGTPWLAASAALATSTAPVGAT
ncbi:hypothetical protein HaLaN_15152, partial [Haematococcus lacustris]